MTLRYISFLAVAASAMGLTGCEWMPGRPKLADKWEAPEEVVSFSRLYSSNCLGCHGMGSTAGAALAMDNPTYLAVLPPDVLAKVVSDGIPGTAMPGFSKPAGGTLTAAQIKSLVDGILAKKPTSAVAGLPSYAGTAGDFARGAQVFAGACASCHGDAGTGTSKAGSVVDANYLDLVSNQYLRSVVIAGRPDLGCPGFASHTPGKPLSDTEISDVVAWIASHRHNEFGQPLVAPK